MTDPVFVFGSNLMGWHGGGAAKFALNKRGAIWGVGVGLQGNSYAIPTKVTPAETLDLPTIGLYTDQFNHFAAIWKLRQVQGLPERIPSYLLTQVGCGLAGLKAEDVAPMFASAPANVIMPLAWMNFLPKVNVWKWHDEGKLL